MASIIFRRRRRRLNRAVLRRPRVFRDLSNPLESLEEEEIFQRYRFSPTSILFIVNGVHDHLQRDTARNRPIPPLIQVLLFLRFVATGAHLRLIGDSLNVSECTTGRVVKAVARAIITVFMNLIKFPSGELATKVKEGFRRVAGFPKVVGCIDGTQIRIQAPSVNEPDYVNRKGFHSLNVQMVCDPTFKVTSLCARWPGSCHDSRIWRNSHLCQQFENGVFGKKSGIDSVNRLHDGILLGDSGYPLTRYLMTPYLAPVTRSEERYNASLCQTRVLIEQTFGIMKRRFQALQTGFRVSPDQAVQFITACVVLHNLGIDRGDICVQQNLTNIDVAACIQQHIMEPGQVRNDGVLKRAAITQGFF